MERTGFESIVAQNRPFMVNSIGSDRNFFYIDHNSTSLWINLGTVRVFGLSNSQYKRLLKLFYII